MRKIEREMEIKAESERENWREIKTERRGKRQEEKEIK